MKNRLPLYQYSDAKKGIEKSDLYKSYIVSQKPLMSDFMMLKTQEEEQQDDFVRFEEELAAFLGGLFVQRTEIEKQHFYSLQVLIFL